MSTPENETNSSFNINEAKEYVWKLLDENLSPNISFHTIEHTERVFKTAKQLAKKSKLSHEDKMLLYIAALFHDTGFINSYNNHESESASIAVQYLRDKQFPEEKIDIVNALIEATKPELVPVTLLQKILCDADTAHIGSKNYFYFAELLRKEWDSYKEDFNPTDVEWAEENFLFLQNHRFYTNVANKKYQKNKNKNLQVARKLLDKEKTIETKKWDNFSVANNKAALTMFKTALRNHIDLTAIADQKSNMMLSVNAFLLTIGLPIFASYLTEKVYLLVPSIIFMFTCVITMIFATLATRPMKMDGETDLSKIHTNKTNLFFFGNFYSIPLEDYHDAIKKVITHRESLDISIINDLYFLGHSLGDKFRYLRMCYNVFIIGIFSCVIAFLISYFSMR